jgi:hypothetical protein
MCGDKLILLRVRNVVDRFIQNVKQQFFVHKFFKRKLYRWWHGPTGDNYRVRRMYMYILCHSEIFLTVPSPSVETNHNQHSTVTHNTHPFCSFYKLPFCHFICSKSVHIHNFPISHDTRQSFPWIAVIVFHNTADQF